MRAGFWLSMALLVVTACSDDRDVRHDALLLLDRYERIQDEDPARRMQHIEAFAKVPVTEPKLVALRDDCARFHRLLLKAETVHATAPSRADLAALSQEEQAAAARDVAEAGDAIRAVRILGPACIDRMGELRARYPRRAAR